METSNRWLMFILIAATVIVIIFLLSDRGLIECPQVVILEEESSELVVDSRATQIKKHHNSTERFFRSAHL